MRPDLFKTETSAARTCVISIMNLEASSGLIKQLLVCRLGHDLSLVVTTRHLSPNAVMPDETMGKRETRKVIKSD